MALDRRIFLRRLLLGGAAISQANLLDPDFWKWVPGAKTIIEVPALVMPTYAEVMTFGGSKVLMDEFFKSTALGAAARARISHLEAVEIVSPVLKQFGIAPYLTLPNVALRVADKPTDQIIGVRKWDGKLVTWEGY